MHESLSFQSDIQSKVGGLELQKERAFSYEFKQGVSPVHDVDFYVVLLRRLYRQIETSAKCDSRVANLKGKYADLAKKIKIRDHFEHGVDFEKLPTIGPIDNQYLKVGSGVKVSTSLVGSIIMSGAFTWNLHKDHGTFLAMAQEYVKLFPFEKPKPAKTETVLSRLFRHLGLK